MRMSIFLTVRSAFSRRLSCRRMAAWMSCLGSPAGLMSSAMQYACTPWTEVDASASSMIGWIARQKKADPRTQP